MQAPPVPQFPGPTRGSLRWAPTGHDSAQTRNAAGPGRPPGAVTAGRLSVATSGFVKSHPVRPLALAAVAGVAVAVAAVLAPAGAGWVGRYDHRLRAYTAQEARQARSQAHRQARRHHRPYRAPVTVYGRLEPWRYHAHAALTSEVVARALALTFGVVLALGAAVAAAWERGRARAVVRTAPPRGGLVTGGSAHG